MNCLRYQTAIRSHHKTSHLCIDCHISHSCRNQNFLIYLADALTDLTDIIRCLIRSVRDSHTTGKIDKLHMSACFLLQINCQLKQFSGKHRIILVSHCITCKERMNTKFLCSLSFQNLKCFEDLLCGHTIFGISRIVHNIIADLE